MEPQRYVLERRQGRRARRPGHDLDASRGRCHTRPGRGRPGGRGKRDRPPDDASRVDGGRTSRRRAIAQRPLAETGGSAAKRERAEPRAQDRHGREHERPRRRGDGRSRFLLKERLRLLDRLGVDRDLDVVAEHDPARVERLVPVDAELFPVDRRLGVEAVALGAVGTGPRTEEGDVHHDRLLDAVHVQHAAHLRGLLLLVDVRHLRALEGDLRVLLDVEEIRGAEVLVALLVVGVDARGIDRAVDRALLRRVGIELDLAVELVETTGHVAEEVADLEAHVGVRRVDLQQFGRGGERYEKTDEGDEGGNLLGHGRILDARSLDSESRLKQKSATRGRSRRCGRRCRFCWSGVWRGRVSPRRRSRAHGARSSIPMRFA